MKGIEIWIADLDTLFRDLDSNAKKRPSARFHAPRILLGLALSAAEDASSAEWAFDVDKPGELALAQGESVARVNFDMSQSGRLVAVALSSNGPVGLSLETLDSPETDRAPDETAETDELDAVTCAIRESVFTERELDQLDEYGEPGSRLRWMAAQRLWAAKDARAKRASIVGSEDAAPIAPLAAAEAATPRPRWARLEGRELVLDSGRYYLALSAEAGPAADIRVVDFVSRQDSDDAATAAQTASTLAESPIEAARPSYLTLASAPTGA